MKIKNQKSKIKNLLIVTILFVLFFPLISQAALVPCGGRAQPACQFCHIFVLLTNIVDFIFKFVLVVAALIFIIGGFYLLTAGPNPESFSKAKAILTAAAIGLVIIFVAYLFIGTFLQMIGLADWTTEIYKNWWEKGFFQINCPI